MRLIEEQELEYSTGTAVAHRRGMRVPGGGGGTMLLFWPVFWFTSVWCVVAAYLACIGVIDTEP